MSTIAKAKHRSVGPTVPGLFEWEPMDSEQQGDWLGSTGSRAVVHAVGQFESVRILGSLFDDDGAEIGRLTPGKPLLMLPVAPTRICPVVEAGDQVVVRVHFLKG